MKGGEKSTMSTQQLKQKGFTIIEVVLVLAIAALIFLMVFIALPALQRNQRDTARKTVLSKVASAVTNYQSNNRGAQPETGAALAGYVDGTEQDGDATMDNEYTVKAGTIGDVGEGYGAADITVVQVIVNAKCGAENKATADGASKRNAAVIMKMENGSAFTCQTI